jgi:hypothetical protein
MFLVVVKLTGEFTLLEEPTDDFDIFAVAVFLVDGSDFIGFERRIEHKELTRKFMLPNIRYVSCSKLAKTGVRVGG